MSFVWAAIVQLAGTAASAGLLLERFTTRPNGKAAGMVTVPVWAGAPLVALAGTVTVSGGSL